MIVTAYKKPVKLNNLVLMAPGREKGPFVANFKAVLYMDPDATTPEGDNLVQHYAQKLYGWVSIQENQAHFNWSRVNKDLGDYYMWTWYFTTVEAMTLFKLTWQDTFRSFS